MHGVRRFFATACLLGACVIFGCNDKKETPAASNPTSTSSDAGNTNLQPTSGKMLVGPVKLSATPPLEKPTDMSGPKSGKIKIFSSLPRTGSAKGQSDTIVNGIKLALKEVDYKIGDFTIEYEDLDDATAALGNWDAQRETSNAEKARNDPDVMAYIGTYNSGAAAISMPILNRARVLMISPANTSPNLTKPGMAAKDEPYRYRPSGKINYFRVVPTDDVQGPAAAHFLQKKGIRSVYILDDNEVYGKGIADLFRSECEEVRIKVIAQESIDVKAQEFKALMLKIKERNPGAIYFGGTTQTKAGQLAKDMVAAGINVPFVVPDGCYEGAFIESAGADTLNGRCYITFGGLPVSELSKTQRGKSFVTAYEKEFGKLPDEAYAVYGYECAKVALAAIRKAGVKNREAIIWAASTLNSSEIGGALDDWCFTTDGDSTLQTMSINRIEGGKFVFDQLITIKKGE